MKNQTNSSKKNNNWRTFLHPDIPIVHEEKYRTLNGKEERRVSEVADGSIITLFDKTPPPRKPKDVICPHFMELKWANGCPFNCSYCYLQGTFRSLERGKDPHIKNFRKISRHLKAFFLEAPDRPEILNTGEVSDSFLSEGTENPFSTFILRKFKEQEQHKVLFVTKSNWVDHLLQPEFKDPTYAIVSFSLNPKEITTKWEKGTPSPKERIKAAKKVDEFGYETRIRIDPMIPLEGWSEFYKELVDEIFNRLRPERVTLGSLRGLSTTIRNAWDRSWVPYLSESSNWGKKIDLEKRIEMYDVVITHLEEKWNFTEIGLCKETTELWEELGRNWKNITCNCIR